MQTGGILRGNIEVIKIQSKTLFILLAIAIGALIVGIALLISGGDLLGKREVSELETNVSVVTDDNATLVIASKDELLGKYEKSDRLFNITEVGDMIVYRHQRMIDGAKVEKDRIVYQFDKDTKELKKKIIHWRDDLPEHLPAVIPKEEAESIAGGGSAILYFISPESDVFPIKPAPENPCWVVWKAIKTDEYVYYNITIVDAVEGKILGYGVPPPS